MAGLLRRKIINAETPTRLEVADEWKPFSWQEGFVIAQEMSPDAVSTRVEKLEEEAENARHPIPMPSRDTVLKLGGMVFGLLFTGAGAYLVAKADEFTGYCLLFAGGGAAMAAQCLIWARLLDEEF